MSSHRCLATCRALLAALLAVAPAGCRTGDDAGRAAAEAPADLVVLDAAVTTQDEARPEARALAARDGVLVAVGDEQDVLPLIGPRTRVVRAGGRRLIPGLVDSHLHAVRGGRFFNLELRWDGVASLAEALALVREQARRTPPGQWVRVVGGWSPHQFAEDRMPTPAELHEAAGEVPAFVLYLYSQALLNEAGVQALGLTERSPPPPGGRYEFVEGGAILHADPDPAILYGTIARLPSLSADDQLDSTRRFQRELNRLGITSVVDPGGGGHAWPHDYEAARAVASGPGLPLRISNYLFAQSRGREQQEVEGWVSTEQPGVDLAPHLAHGYVVEGAGENLVWSAGDFENFLAPAPELSAVMEGELSAVVRVLAEHGWPLRIHATYDASIGRILDVLEPLFAETGYRARWAIDHAETISERNLARIAALGGGIAVQDRLAFAGEEFVARYGAEAAAHAPPLRRMLQLGIPVGAGTDGTRVSSYDPWTALAWLVTGRTVGGTPLAAPENRLSRAEALRLYTLGSAWFSGEEHRKGRLAPGQDADFAILSADYASVPDDAISGIESLLTVTGGRIVHAAGPFVAFAPPPLPAVSPAWSPLALQPGVARGAGRTAAAPPAAPPASSPAAAAPAARPASRTGDPP